MYAEILLENIHIKSLQTVLYGGGIIYMQYKSTEKTIGKNSNRSPDDLTIQ